MFSLSSDGDGETIQGSLETNAGVVGVRGKSSEMSETVVVVLMGVLNAELGTEMRVGVTGKAEKEWRTNLPP